MEYYECVNILILIMSLNNICREVLKIPLSAHQGWRGALLFFQSACLAIYAVCVWFHRNRIFCPVKFRKWDLDLVFMTLSVAAAATGVVTWAFWTETNFANVRCVFEVFHALFRFCDYFTLLRTRVKC